MSANRKRKRAVTVTEVVHQIHAPNFTLAADWMKDFLAQSGVLSKLEVELVIASYIYMPSNAEEVQLFFQSEYGLVGVPSAPRVNQLVGKDYLASHCKHFLRQYHDVIVKCRPSFKEAFFRLFADHFDDYIEAQAFKNIYNFDYPLNAPVIDTREDIKSQNLSAMNTYLQSTDYVIITGAGVSSAIVSRADADSAKCAGSWDGLVTVLKHKIEAFVGDIIRGYFTKWYPNFDTLPMVEKGTVLYKMIKVFNLYHNTNIDYTRFVYDAFARVQASGDHSLATAIASRHVPIATTNYDMLLEQCLGRFECNITRECDEAPFLSKVASKAAAQAKAKAAEVAKFTKSNHQHHIYHLHGVWYSDTKLTLGVEYAALDSHFHTAMAILSEEDSRPIVFLGTKSGVFDPHFQPWLSRSTQKHYIIVKDNEFENMVQAISDAQLVQQLVPVVYGTQYNELAAFIATMLPQKSTNAIVV